MSSLVPIPNIPIHFTPFSPGYIASIFTALGWFLQNVYPLPKFACLSMFFVLDQACSAFNSRIDNILVELVLVG